MEFTKWWTTEFKTVKFPSQGTVFDYFIDSETKKFEPWVKKVEKFELDTEIPLQVYQCCCHLLPTARCVSTLPQLLQI